MNLPSAVQTYFEADSGSDPEYLLTTFATDAVVKDEGEFHIGHAAIASWWREAKARYEHRSEPLEAEDRDGRTKVRARVTGAFPGSPATLTFTFRLERDRISRLEIDA